MNDVLVRRPSPSSSANRIRLTARRTTPPRSFAQDLLRWGVITVLFVASVSVATAWIANLLAD